MANLKRASQQLFARPDDERFQSLDDLYAHCAHVRDQTEKRWQMPNSVSPSNLYGRLGLEIGFDGEFQLNDWSFGQVCSLANVQKETVNRLQSATAAQVLRETLPIGKKPLQVLTQGDRVRAIHGASYTRLFDADLLDVVLDTTHGFTPPPKGFNGATGLYAGEQDMFAFLIDDSAWVEIDNEPFAPGFFIWNSEVGRRTVGVETFWYQKLCSNHIVWDAIEVVSFSRKHTAKVGDSLQEIREIIGRLVSKRDQRRDAFARSVRTAMKTELGDAEAATKVLTGRGLPAKMLKSAIEEAQAQTPVITVFDVVAALTRRAREYANAGDRTELDGRIGSLFTLAV